MMSAQNIHKLKVQFMLFLHSARILRNIVQFSLIFSLYYRILFCGGCLHIRPFFSTTEVIFLCSLLFFHACRFAFVHTFLAFLSDAPTTFFQQSPSFSTIFLSTEDVIRIPQASFTGDHEIRFHLVDINFSSFTPSFLRFRRDFCRSQDPPTSSFRFVQII